MFKLFYLPITKSIFMDNLQFTNIIKNKTIYLKYLNKFSINNLQALDCTQSTH